MKHLTAADCLWSRVKHVLEEERPGHVPEGTIYAVFSNHTKNKTFYGLASTRDIALHPDWIFADLVEHRPLMSVTSDCELVKVLKLMRETHREALPVVNSDGHFLGAVTSASLLSGLLKQEHVLLKESKQLYQLAEKERQELVIWSDRLSRLHEASRTLLNVLAHTALEDELLHVGIEALTKLLEAKYGAIGILNAEGGLAQFCYTGITEKQRRPSAIYLKARGCWGW